MGLFSPHTDEAAGPVVFACDDDTGTPTLLRLVREVLAVSVPGRTRGTPAGPGT